MKSSLKKIIKSAMYCGIILLTSCISNSYSNANYSNEDVFVYRIENTNSERYKSVKGIVLIDNKIYFEPNDSMLLTLSGLSNRCIKINDLDLKETINQIINDVKRFNPRDCQCGSLTKNEYIIRVRTNTNTEEFFLNENLNCVKTDKCSLPENLKMLFKKYSNT